MKLDSTEGVATKALTKQSGLVTATTRQGIAIVLNSATKSCTDTKSAAAKRGALIPLPLGAEVYGSWRAAASDRAWIRYGDSSVFSANLKTDSRICDNSSRLSLLFNATYTYAIFAAADTLKLMSTKIPLATAYAQREGRVHVS